MVSLLQPSQGTNSADLGLLTSRTDNAVCCLRPPVCNSLLWQLSPQGIGSIAYFSFYPQVVVKDLRPTFPEHILKILLEKELKESKQHRARG